jgi:aryl-alcohol dehydrogenase-like predicted oxidoreductase
MVETLQTYAELIKEGKVRSLGASIYHGASQGSAETANAHGLLRYECPQPRFNLYDRDDFKGELNSSVSKRISASFPITVWPAVF